MYIVNIKLFFVSIELFFGGYSSWAVLQILVVLWYGTGICLSVGLSLKLVNMILTKAWRFKHVTGTVSVTSC